MGVCSSRPQVVSKQSSNSISHSSTPEKWTTKKGSSSSSSKNHAGPESTMNPMVSMSFLRKYSFATVNPAFADFENVLRNSEEEDAASKLRSLARQSFSGWHDPPCEKKVSFRHARVDEEHEDFSRNSCSKLEEGPWQEIEELNGCSDQASVDGSKDDSTSCSVVATNQGTNQVITEEQLVLSSSCMPDCSLGLVAVPEPRAGRRQALGKRSPSGSTATIGLDAASKLHKASNRQLHHTKKKRILVAS